MKTFEHVPDIEGFVKPNDDLAASRLPTDEHIIDSVLQKEDSGQDSDERIQCRNSAPKLSGICSQAQGTVQTLKNFYKINETLDDVTFKASSVIKRSLRDIKIK